jgi:predicted DNA-binding mobile mystery protein A
MNKKLQRKQLDTIFQQVHALRAFPPPARGWLRAIRESLGMPLRELAHRMGTSPQAAQQFEKREAEQSITLASLKNAADRLDCELVYAIVPRRPLADMIHHAAEEAADAILTGAAQTMELENQSIAADTRRSAREELILELENDPRRVWRPVN